MDTRGDFYKKARYKETKRVQLMADRKRLPIVEFNETRFQEARNRGETKKKKEKGVPLKLPIKAICIPGTFAAIAKPAYIVGCG